MLKMSSHGSIERLLHLWMNKKPVACFTVVDREDLALGYDKLLTLFLVLVSGFVLSMFICLFEKIKIPLDNVAIEGKGVNIENSREYSWIDEMTIREMEKLQHEIRVKLFTLKR